MLLEESPRSPSQNLFNHQNEHEVHASDFMISPKSYKRKHKRILSSSSPNSKRSKLEQALKYSARSKNSSKYPMFEHPDGDGMIQQTPYGSLKITKKGKIETTVLDNSITLETFTKTQACGNNYHNPCDNSSEQWSNVTNPKKSPVIGGAGNSPSDEIESYMIEGYGLRYRGPLALNKSYRYHEEKILNINYGLYDSDVNECDDLDRSREYNDNEYDLDHEMN